jgi:hypothetical protein
MKSTLCNALVVRSPRLTLCSRVGGQIRLEENAASVLRVKVFSSVLQSFNSGDGNSNTRICQQGYMITTQRPINTLSLYFYSLSLEISALNGIRYVLTSRLDIVKINESEEGHYRSMHSNIYTSTSVTYIL